MIPTATEAKNRASSFGLRTRRSITASGMDIAMALIIYVLDLGFSSGMGALESIHLG